MAEFVDVMKQVGRMCKSHNSCRSCIVKDKNIICREFLQQNPQEAEEIIMKWVKEHPIQTNADKFKEVFGFLPNYHCIKPQSCKDCKDFAKVKCKHIWWEEEYKAPEEVSV